MLEFQKEIEKLPQDDSATMEEKLLLYALVRATKPVVCIETGTHKGLSALYIAHALYDNGKGMLYTADPHDYGQKENIAKFPELRKHIKVLLKEGVKIKVPLADFFFCDGNHDCPEVEKEIDYFLPNMTKDALIVFHDCDRTHWNDFEGVNRAIETRGLQTVFIKSKNRMRIYAKS